MHYIYIIQQSISVWNLNYEMQQSLLVQLIMYVASYVRAHIFYTCYTS